MPVRTFIWRTVGPLLDTARLLVRWTDECLQHLRSLGDSFGLLRPLWFIAQPNLYDRLEVVDID